MVKHARAPGVHRIDAHVGRRLFALRKARGLTQKQLADRLGLTHKQVQKYEKGSNRMTAVTLFEIACILQAPVGDFFAGLPGAAQPSADSAAASAAANGALLDAIYALPPAAREHLIAFLDRMMTSN
jgi:transcriptional regulator with XRE-family HTH domain